MAIQCLGLLGRFIQTHLTYRIRGKCFYFWAFPPIFYHGEVSSIIGTLIDQADQASRSPISAMLCLWLKTITEPKHGVWPATDQMSWEPPTLGPALCDVKHKLFHPVLGLNWRDQGYSLVILVGGLDPWNFMTFPSYWECHIPCHHPNWRIPSFFGGVGQPPTLRVRYWKKSF